MAKNEFSSNLNIYEIRKLINFLIAIRDFTVPRNVITRTVKKMKKEKKKAAKKLSIHSRAIDKFFFISMLKFL